MCWTVILGEQEVVGVILYYVFDCNVRRVVDRRATLCFVLVCFSWRSGGSQDDFV